MRPFYLQTTIQISSRTCYYNIIKVEKIRIGINMITPQKYQARLSDRLDYNDDYSQYRFELISPSTMTNQAGQFVLIQIDDRTARSYSMSDRPDVQASFELLVDHRPHGPGTTFLRQLKFGEQIEAILPLGKFVVKDDPAVQELIFLATGSGIAPIKSILTDQLQNRHDSRPLTLFWGMRHDSDLFWLDFFADLQKSFSNFNFIPVISQPSPNWRLATGHITDYLEKITFKVPTQFYICGNAKMQQAVKDILAQKSIKPEFIITEQF